MYKNGLHFPIFYFFLNDDVTINDLQDIIFRKNNFIVDTEDNTFNAIVEFINQSKGYEIFPFLLNNFDYLIQTNLVFDNKIITSKFIKITEFIMLIKQFKIDFIKIDSTLGEIEKIGLLDKPVFYSELYKLLYRSFVLKLGKIINYSDNESVELFINFNLDYKKFENYQNEIQNRRPFIINNYEYKKHYVSSFIKAFNTNNSKAFSTKIEVIKSHSDKEILRTFKKIINYTFIVNEGVNPKTRNKVFKPIYVEINSAISGKAYDENTKSALTKEIKRFFSNI
jgi:hypothetical protein